MGHNRAGDNAKRKLRRRLREEARLERKAVAGQPKGAEASKGSASQGGERR
jgi:hypothetical protein